MRQNSSQCHSTDDTTNHDCKLGCLVVYHCLLTINFWIADFTVYVICSYTRPVYKYITTGTANPITTRNLYKVGTCESLFFVRIELAVRFVFESNRPYTTQAVTQPNGLQSYRTASVSLLHLQRIFNPSVFCICDEREWCTDYGTLNWVLVYFNSVIKRVKQCCCTLILLPKSTLNANLTTTNSFFTDDDWQRGRFFESDHQYEFNLESDVRFEIESQSFAVPTTKIVTLTRNKSYSICVNNSTTNSDITSCSYDFRWEDRNCVAAHNSFWKHTLMKTKWNLNSNNLNWC